MDKVSNQIALVMKSISIEESANASDYCLLSCLCGKEYNERYLCPSLRSLTIERLLLSSAPFVRLRVEREW
ncbi:hypothetical protein QJS04_geneDACA024949 [Acorus gramineus]|uniref:Uncharacterized protein n=1 Tax=Acorus gramineus TaxID=55184 RepID=A0AAV9A3G3_ACOGR|nr:hypothetical protein QJS04_geneDACA024949 [Acorus gramineus]